MAVMSPQAHSRGWADRSLSEFGHKGRKTQNHIQSGGATGLRVDGAVNRKACTGWNWMAGFREPSFIERQAAAAKARKADLEKFRANAADPAAAERQKARMADAAERAERKRIREIEKAEKKKRDDELALAAKREAALQAERALIEKKNRELALEAERKAARDARYAARKKRTKGTR